MDNTETTERKDVVPSQYREKYKATNGGCGDFIAEALTRVGKDGVEALNSVKRENGIDPARWGDANPGMQRMNLANTLRATFLKGGTIKILGREYNAKHIAEDFNGELANTDSCLGKLADLLGVQDNERTLAALRKTFFPPEKKAGKTAEDRAAEKAEKAAAKEAEKAEKAAERAAAAKAKEAEKAEKAAAKEAEKAAAKQKKADERAEKAAAKEAEKAASAAE